MKANVYCKGYCYITDLETGMVHGPVCNDIHPQNFSVAIARAMAGMDNGNVYQMAFGLGSTSTTPNVTNWDDTQYNEVYNEIVDATTGMLGYGNGAVPSMDQPNVLFVSGSGCRIEEQTNGCKLIVECMLNKSEPISQDLDNTATPYYIIKEISLFTKGRELTDTKGYQDIKFPPLTPASSRYLEDLSGLDSNTLYAFNITIDGSTPKEVTFLTGNQVPTVSDVKSLIESAFASLSINATVEGSSNVNAPNSRATFGALRILSNTTGDDSSILITPPTTPGIPYLVNSLGASLSRPKNGENAGLRNNPSNQDKEARRLLTHLILNTPFVKTATNAYKFTYVIEITVV